MSRDPHSADGAPLATDVTAGSQLDPRSNEELESAIISARSSDGDGDGDDSEALRPPTAEQLAERDRNAREFFGFGLPRRERRKRQRRAWRREQQLFPYLVETAAAEERAWRARCRAKCPPTTYPATLPALPGRRSTPALLSRFKRPRTAGRPRTSHAPRPVSSSRGDPDPGDGEPPPVKQGRGEADAHNLRLPLRADRPAVAAFAAAYGHLPPHEQALVDALAPAGAQDGFWADLERDAARWRDTAGVPPEALQRAAERLLRAFLARVALLPPHDPWAVWEPPLGLWRLRRLRCSWMEWRDGLRRWSWRRMRWETQEVEDR